MMSFCSGTSDIFSYGMVLYEIINRKSPFQELDENAARDAIVKNTPLKLSQNVTDAYPGLINLFYSFTQYEASRRVESFELIIDQLEAIK